MPSISNSFIQLVIDVFIYSWMCYKVNEIKAKLWCKQQVPVETHLATRQEERKHKALGKISDFCEQERGRNEKKKKA